MRLNGDLLIDDDLTVTGDLNANLDASKLTTGTVPDARLSSNVALENLPNTFTQPQTISGTQQRYEGASHITWARPGPPDGAKWHSYALTNFVMYPINDAENAITNPGLVLDRNGLLTVGSVSANLNASQLTSGIVPAERLPTTTPTTHHVSHEPGGTDVLVNAAWRHVDNNFVAQHIGSYTTIFGANGALYLHDTSAAANNKALRLINYSNGNLYVEFMDDAGGVQARPLTLERTTGHVYTHANLQAAAAVVAGTSVTAGAAMSAGTTIRAGAGLYELGRGPAIGDWTDVAFNAAYFYGMDCNWVVTAATYSYMLIGHSMWISLQIVYTNSTVSPGGYHLAIGLPAGATVNRATSAQCTLIQNDASYRVASVDTEAGGGGRLIVRPSTYPANAFTTGPLGLRLTICVNIN